MPLWGLRQGDLCESEASLVHPVTSIWTETRETLSKTKQKQKKQTKKILKTPEFDSGTNIVAIFLWSAELWNSNNPRMWQRLRCDK